MSCIQRHLGGGLSRRKHQGMKLKLKTSPLAELPLQLTNFMERVVFEMLRVSKLVKRSPAFHWTITVESCSQEPLVHILSQVNPGHMFTSYFFKVHLNIILLYTPTKLSVPYRFSYQNYVRIFYLFHAIYMPRLSHPPLFSTVIVLGE